MSYQKIELIYGQTVDIEEWGEIYEKIVALYKKEQDIPEDDDVDDYEMYEHFGIEARSGFYNDTMKIGIVIQEDEVRTMQNFVFDFDIPNPGDLKVIIKDNREFFNQIGLDTDEFTLGVCTYNY